MVNEIPAGTKVFVFGKPGEVLAHMDGVVHVDIDGQVVSVSPDQIDTGDAPVQQSSSPSGSGTVLAALQEFATAAHTRIDVLGGQVNALAARITTLEDAAKNISPEPSAADLDAVAAEQAVKEATAPAATSEANPGTEKPTEESTTAAA